MMPKISVIIPVYNTEKLLKLCVDSILSQDYPDVEIILVNDGSSDNSPLICDDYAAKFEQVHVIHQSNKGVSFARNTGLEHATGDFIAFVDADDLLFSPRSLTLLMEAITSSKADMAIGRCVYRNRGREHIEAFSLEKRLYTGEEFLEATLDDHSICYYVWRVLYRASFIKGLRFEVGRITGEDSFFIFQCACRKPTVVLIEDPVYIYSANMLSVTHSALSDKKYDDLLFLMKKKLELIRDTYPHLSDKSRNLEIKLHMMLLYNMLGLKGDIWKKRQKHSLEAFHKNKSYFVSASRDNAQWYRILKYRLYSPYKVYFSCKRLAKKLLKP